MPYNLFILGSPNSVDGILSSTAINRILKAIALQKIDPEIVLMATGGFGSHFNTSASPHRELIHQYLVQQDAEFNPGHPGDLLSSNSVEDATTIAQYFNSRGRAKFGIVTSGFHMARCQYIFECVFEKDLVDFFAADDPSSLHPDILRHESTALAQLRAQGGVLIDGKLHRHMKLCE
jgi:uncharacterized SAM-binding protein YcdF (DUF218 family)